MAVPGPVPPALDQPDSSGRPTAPQSVLVRRRFDLDVASYASRDRLWLRINGAFDLAEVWVDDRYVGDTRSPWADNVFDITPSLRPGGTHVLAVELMCDQPAPHSGQNGFIQSWFENQPGASRNRSPIGLALAPAIHRTGPAAITASRLVCTSCTEDSANVRATLTLDAIGALRADVTVAIDAAVIRKTVALSPGENNVEFDLEIPQPRRWWPRGMGEQALADATVTVDVDGHPSDHRSCSLGLRSIKVSRGRYSINDRPLHLVGIAASTLADHPAMVTRKVIQTFFERLTQIGANSVRVMGHVAPQSFYESADRLGIAVIQDLPLAGAYGRRAIRPAHKMAVDTISVLAHHPSIIEFWCHDDPSGWLAIHEDADVRTARRRAITRTVLPSWNRNVLDRSISELGRKVDPSRRFVPGIEPFPTRPWTEDRPHNQWVSHGMRSDIDLYQSLRSWPRAARAIARFDPTSHVDPTDEAAVARLKAVIEWARACASTTSGAVFVEATLTEEAAGGSASSGRWTSADSALATAFSESTQSICPIVDIPSNGLISAEGTALDIHVLNDTDVTHPNATATVLLRWGDRTHSWRFRGSIGAEGCTRIGTIQVGPLRYVGTATIHVDVVFGPPNERLNRTNTYVVNVHSHARRQRPSRRLKP